MATTGEVWRAALDRVDPELLAGPLGDRRGRRPSRNAIKQVWPTLFADLEKPLREKTEAIASSEDEHRIEQAVAARSDDLRTVHAGVIEAAALIKRDLRHPDLWSLTRQGREQTQAALSIAMAAWAEQISVEQAYTHRRARSRAYGPDAPADSGKVRRYLKEHAADAQAQLEQAWQSTHQEPHRQESAPNWPPVGTLPLPWEQLGPEYLEQMQALLDRVGGATVAHHLRLRAQPEPSCPPVLTPRRGTGDPPVRPLDRSLWRRLARGTYGAPPDPIGSIISQEIIRICRPLGLAQASGEAVLIAGCLMMRAPVDIDLRSLNRLRRSSDVQVTRQVAIGFSVRKRLTRAVGWPVPAQIEHRLVDPLHDFSATLWTRLHSWERDHHPHSGTSAAITAAYRSWLWNLTRSSTAAGLPDTSSDQPGPGSTEDQPESVSGEELMQILVDLTRAIPAVREDLRTGRPTPERWAEVMSEARRRSHPCPTYEQLCEIFNIIPSEVNP